MRFRNLIAIALALMLLVGAAPVLAQDCPPGTIVTVAGGGDGDGAPALHARFGDLQNVALGPDGSIYICDGNRVRKVDPRGIATTIAGTGAAAYSGDGGPAAKAALNAPHAVRAGPDGCVYVADAENHRIRKIDAAGVITTAAGDGQGRFAGDGAPASQASLYKPWGLDFGADGSLYIADSWNNRVRKIAADGIITTVAGNGERTHAGDGGPATAASLYNPRAVAVAPDGALYIADRENHRVRKVDTEGIITTFAGSGEFEYAGDGGPAAAAALWNPLDLAIGPDGSVYIADSNQRRVRRVDRNGVITTFAGNGEGGYSGDGGPATEAAVGDPFGVAVAPDGSVYIADRSDDRVRVVRPGGIITTIAGCAPEWPCGDGGPAVNACLRKPRALAVGPDGSLYIADGNHHRVAKVDPAGVITSLLGDGAPERPCGYDGWRDQQDCLNSPFGVALGPDGSLYVAYAADHRVRRIAPDGAVTIVAGTGEAGFSGDGGPADQARLNQPHGVAVAPDETLYIADMGNQRVRKISPAGVITTIAGDGWSDEWNVGRFAGDGGSALKASLNRPVSVVVGRDGSVFIADSWNQAIRRVDRNGKITTFAGTAQRGFFGDGGPAAKARLSYPTSVAIGVDGSVYIADPGNIRIRRVDRGGMIATIAGGGFPPGGIGDGGPATDASLRTPLGVAVGPDGTVYIADSDHNLIRKVCAGAGR